jgi:chromatin modification-related protein EAF6
MADKQQGGAGAAADSGGSVPVNMAEYKKSQARVRDLVEKRRLLEKRLVRYIYAPPTSNLSGES